jgi:hypothetical protein
MRKLILAIAILAAAAGGIASASVVTPDPPSDEPGHDPAVPGSDRIGEPIADAGHNGPPWAVRTYLSQGGRRCIAVGRTDGPSFGSVDQAGKVHDLAVDGGNCADPPGEPLQVALAEYADAGGTGPRSVLFAVADATVTAVDVSTPDGPQPAKIDRWRTLVVVRDGLSPEGIWTVVATLTDGTSRTYRL